MAEIELPQNLQQTEKAGFTIMKKFMIDMFGESYVTRVLAHNMKQFATKGVFSWKPDDGNIVVDISPMPPPWEGDWGYRLRFCAILPGADVVVNQFYVPHSAIPAFRKGDYSALN